MVTFEQMKTLLNELQEKQNKLLELYKKNKEDTNVVIEFNKLGCALYTAYKTLEPFSNERR